MKTGLRHTHIAVRRPLGTLARALSAPVASGSDDLGNYRFFDLNIVHEDGGGQSVRFASHAGDSMVHLLAEDINAVSDLAAALFAVGIGSQVKLSISADQEGRPLRNLAAIRERIAAMSASNRSQQTKPNLRWATSSPVEIVHGQTNGGLTKPEVILH